MKLIISIFLFLCTYIYSFGAEGDSTLYNTYRNQVVLYSYLGFHSAPFSIKDDFNLGVKKVHYKHNLRPILGFGIAYKWLKFRFGIGLPANLRSEKKFGESQYTTLGFSLNPKQMFWSADIKFYQGYVIPGAYKWNNLISKDSSSFHPNINTLNIAIDAWHFKTKNYKMPTSISKVDDIKASVGSYFYKYSLSIFGVTGNSQTITPIELIDTTQTRSFARAATSLDFAFLPGYSYVYKHNNWRIAGVAGLGLALQAKFFEAKGITRGFLGLSPRVDLRLLTGYSKSKYFVLLVSSLEYKNIVFKEMKYNQTLFSVYVVGGIRLDKKNKVKRKD